MGLYYKAHVVIAGLLFISCMPSQAISPPGVCIRKNGAAFLSKQLGARAILRQIKPLRYSEYLFRWRVRVKRKPEPVISPADLRPEQFRVRVLLNELRHGDSITLHSQNGFLLSDLEALSTSKFGSESLLIARKQNRIYINNKPVKSLNWRIETTSNLMACMDSTYQGVMILVPYDGKVLLINELELEDYITSVLRWESWPGWPKEVNKAFAIACRTYAIAQVLDGMQRKIKKPFHIRNTNIHQTYKGTHSNKIIQQAVKETAGVIMTHNKKPIMAMFDSCCGGVIPAQLSGVDFKQAPYLARTIPCTFCKDCMIYDWKLELDKQEFINLLSASGIALKTLRHIKVHRVDQAGSVQEIRVSDAKQDHFITGKKFYSLLSKVKSFCYTVEKKLEKIYIAGKGYGHHLGICQWGARKMIDHGFNYRNILTFYYPGIAFMKLSMK